MTTIERLIAEVSTPDIDGPMFHVPLPQHIAVPAVAGECLLTLAMLWHEFCEENGLGYSLIGTGDNDTVTVNGIYFS